MARNKKHTKKFYFYPLVATVILGALGILIPLILYFFPINKVRNELKISLVSFSQLIEMKEDLEKSDFNIFYKEQKVENLNYLELRLKNTGTESIIRQDFIRKITLTFPEEIKIINYNVVPDWILNIKQESDHILSFTSDLLNPEDIATIRILFDDHHYFSDKFYSSLYNKDDYLISKLKIDGRILKISNLEIKKFKEQKLLSIEEQKTEAQPDIFRIVMSLTFIAVFLFLFSIVLGYLLKINDEIKFAICYYTLVIVFSFSLLILFYFFDFLTGWM